MNELLETPHCPVQLHTMPGVLWTPAGVSLVYPLQQVYSPLKDCNFFFFFCGSVICFTAVPFMDQDPIMQNVVNMGRTSECYPIIQQRHEKPGQVEGGTTRKQEHRSGGWAESPVYPLPAFPGAGLEERDAAASWGILSEGSLIYLEAEHPVNERWWDWPADSNDLAKISVHPLISGSALVLLCLFSVPSHFQFKHFLREGQTTYNRFEPNDNRFGFSHAI